MQRLQRGCVKLETIGLACFFNTTFQLARHDMTHPLYSPEITAEEISDCQPGVRRSLQYLFDDIFVRAPAAPIATVTCGPFSNDTPPPSGQAMRDPPEGHIPRKATLHLPPCPRTESDSAASRSVWSA